MNKYVLTIACPERIGIVRAVSSFLFDWECTILEAAQFTDLDNDRFFARWEFAPVNPARPSPTREALEQAFAPTAAEFKMHCAFHDAAVKPRVLLAVSKFGHCLNDLLHRWHQEENFPAEVVGVVSNHENFRREVEWYGLPYHYLPVTPETKLRQEAALLEIMKDQGVDLLVLARYMQILSDEMCRALSGRAINIHHSFLPSFKGARPYHQARERGVKLVGATAHYVTSDLDEGPIIEQDVQRVEHNHDVGRMTRLGKNIERIVLARAVYLHCQHRVFLNGHSTVIFR